MASESMSYSASVTLNGIPHIRFRRGFTMPEGIFSTYCFDNGAMGLLELLLVADDLSDKLKAKLITMTDSYEFIEVSNGQPYRYRDGLRGKNPVLPVSTIRNPPKTKQ